jgi:hypothetical protein
MRNIVGLTLSAIALLLAVNVTAEILAARAVAKASQPLLLQHYADEPSIGMLT